MITLTVFDPPFLASLTTGASLPSGVDALDDFEEYTPMDDLDTLNLGLGFAGAYEAIAGVHGVQADDDFEAYTATANLNGQAGGMGFSSSWVAG